MNHLNSLNNEELIRTLSCSDNLTTLEQLLLNRLIAEIDNDSTAEKHKSDIQELSALAFDIESSEISTILNHVNRLIRQNPRSIMLDDLKQLVVDIEQFIDSANNSRDCFNEYVKSCIGDDNDSDN